MVDQADRLYTAAEVRSLDEAAIHGHGIPGIDLMERAGRAVFEAARQAFPEARRWLVLCGGGNNGGDGYVVARLAVEAGLEAEVCALKAPGELKGDAKSAARHWLDSGGSVCAWPDVRPGSFDLLLDALLGTGLDRPPSGPYAEAVEAVNRFPGPVVAIDIPSGLHADSGAVLGSAVSAGITVTFIGNKRGLFTADGPDRAGEVIYSTLQTPDSVRDSQPDSGILIRENILANYFSKRPRNAHKGQFGWLLGVGSDLGMSGAIRLCGEAALRSGAGKVTLLTRPEHAALVNVDCPELMVRGVADTDGLAELLAQGDALAVGTGLGRSGWSQAMLEACFAAPGPMVLDADGLNLLAERVDAGGLPAERWVLTPHPAEAGRLLGRPTGAVQSDRVGSAQELAKRFQAVVALKGCGTVVAAPSGRYAICPLGNPGMATAGTGDVLTGVIGAFLAQGLAPWDAACAGVVAHAAAGDRAAATWGERGLLASDISRCLPAVLNP